MFRSYLGITHNQSWFDENEDLKQPPWIKYVFFEIARADISALIIFVEDRTLN